MIGSLERLYFVLYLVFMYFFPSGLPAGEMGTKLYQLNKDDDDHKMNMLQKPG